MTERRRHHGDDRKVPYRARDQTAPEINERIRAQTRASVAYYAAHPEEIPGRLRELDREWDVERWLQLVSASLSLAGLTLGLTRSRKWLLVPAVVQGFFLQHGVQGWCPPLPLLRRLGARSLGEIEAERHALKALRGDFADARTDENARAILRVAADGGAAPGGSDTRAPLPKPTLTRVPANTAAPVNDRIWRAMEQRVAFYASHPELVDGRLAELDREWDVERVIEVEAPSMTLTSVLLGAVANRAWLGVGVFAQSMMLVHAVQGFYPLLPLFRRAGLRTEDEVAVERYALKVLRGDFERVPAAGSSEAPAQRGDAAFEAAEPA